MSVTDNAEGEIRIQPACSSNDWAIGALDRLAKAAKDSDRVSGLTHQYYRYPARFSPQFVRTAIEQFTKPGDLVFDPFMGGGTTLTSSVYRVAPLQLEPGRT